MNRAYGVGKVLKPVIGAAVVISALNIGCSRKFTPNHECSQQLLCL